MLLAVGAAVPKQPLPHLAEERALVLHDGDGLAAFGHLLQTFAAAGSEEALSLAHSFADVFR